MVARLRAFSIHFALSALVALLSLALVFYIWYPSPLASALGVTHIFLLMLAVDVVLGPLLTLIVYKAGKKTLKLDLAVIGVLQVSALIYGLHTVAEGRPVWLVFSVDRFEAVRGMDLDTRYPDKVAPQYQSLSLIGPRWVAAIQPQDPELRSDVMMESVFSGLDIQHRAYLYHPVAEAAAGIRNHAKPLAALNDFNPEARVREVLSEWPEADAWLPLRARVKPVVVLIKRESAEAVAIVDLAPWA